MDSAKTFSFFTALLLKTTRRLRYRRGTLRLGNAMGTLHGAYAEHNHKMPCSFSYQQGVFMNCHNDYLKEKSV